MLFSDKNPYEVNADQITNHGNLPLTPIRATSLGHDPPTTGNHSTNTAVAQLPDNEDTTALNSSAPVVMEARMSSSRHDDTEGVVGG